MNHFLTLNSISEQDINKVGLRALDLSNAYKQKLAAPLTFIIPNSLFYEFLLQNKLTLEIHKILNSEEKTDDSLEKSYSKIKQLFESAIIPEEFKDDLFEAYEALSPIDAHDAQALLKEDKPIVNLIISPNYTLQSEKFLGILFNIQGFDSFLNGLKSCWLSLYSPEHLKLRESKGIGEFTTGIIVQAFSQPDCTVEAYSKGIIGNYEIPLTAHLGLPDITYKIEKDHYSISKETFGIAQQEISHQSHILLRNLKSGTLIKRNLGSKGAAQKLGTQQILDIARITERLSISAKLHLRILFLTNKSENKLFLVDRICERNQESETSIKQEEKPDPKLIYEPSTQSPEIKITSETDIDLPLSELIKEHTQTEMNKLEKENQNPETHIQIENIVDEKNLPLLKSNEPVKNNPSELSEKIIILDDNDDFILSSDQSQNRNKEKTTDSEDIITESSQKNEAAPSPDNEFFMSIIMDIEPALDQEIMNRYQEKFNKVPSDVTSALEELRSVGEFPENEQIFKLKTMKGILERGETINLEVFLELTENLRKLI